MTLTGAQWVDQQAAAVSDWCELSARAASCPACVLAHARTQVVFADGPVTSELLVIGEAPGAAEDFAGLPFVGRSGQLLRQLLDRHGLLPMTVITNVVKCRPPGNRNPTRDEVATCRGWLRRQLELIDPAVLMPVGAFATTWLLGPRATITTVRGNPHQSEGRLVIPTFHPAAALRSGPAGPQRTALESDIAFVAGLLAGRTGG